MRAILPTNHIKVVLFFDSPRVHSFELFKNNSRLIDYDADLYCLALTVDGIVETNDDLVFFNNISNGNGSICAYGDCISACPDCGDDSVEINLSLIPAQYHTILVICHLYEANQRGQSFDDGESTVQIQKLQEVGCKGEVLFNHSVLSNIGTPDTLELCRITRTENNWEVVFPQEPGIKTDFKDYLKSFGVNV